ncbi:hypothetical protein FOZ63_011696, partial [Perkinsus olseni]
EVEGEEGHGERVLDRDDDELEESLREGSRYDDQAPEEAAAEPEAASLRGYNSDTGDQDEEEDGVPEDLPGFEDADEVHHLARLSSGLEEGFSPGDEESSGHGEPEVRHFSEDNRVDRYKTSFDDEAHSSDELEADTAAVEEGGEDGDVLDSSGEEHNPESEEAFGPSHSEESGGSFVPTDEAGFGTCREFRPRHSYKYGKITAFDTSGRRFKVGLPHRLVLMLAGQ